MAALLSSAAACCVAGGCGSLTLRRANDTIGVAVEFPSDLTSQQVETMLGLVAGLPARSRVTTVVEGREGQLHFSLESDRETLVALRDSLHGVAPGLRLSMEASNVSTGVPALRAQVGWGGGHVLLRRDEPEAAVAALLGVLRGVGSGEHLRLTVRLRPARHTRFPSDRESAVPALLASLWRGPAPSAEHARQVRAAHAGPLLLARIEISIWTANRGRALQLLQRVLGVLRARSGARRHVVVRTGRWAWISPAMILAPAEVVPLIGWPLSGPVLPGLSYARAPLLLPDPAIPSSGGRLFGTSTWPGLERTELHQPLLGSLLHALIVGPTGSGKSSLLARLMLDDIADGGGALLLDMKGDNARDVLERIPASRQDDVVVLDPSDDRALPGLKAIAPDAPELTADLWVGLFRSLFAESWGIRTERYLRLGIQTLAFLPGATITDLPRLFVDGDLRRRLLARAHEPLLASAWASFDALSSAQQAEHLAAPLGKVQDVIGRRVVRAVLGQRAPRMTIARAMAERRIVIVRLAPGELGASTAQLLGALTMYEVYQAVMSRQALSPAERVPYAVHVDEPAVMRFLPVPLDALYELARGLVVRIAVATQSASQLTQVVQRAILSNAGTIATFRCGADDARLIARELLGVSAEQLQHLGQYEIAARLGLAAGKVSSVVTARTLPLPPRSSDPEMIRELAAKRYGVALEQTDRELDGSPDQAIADAPVGRRRRTP